VITRTRTRTRVTRWVTTTLAALALGAAILAFTAFCAWAFTVMFGVTT